jgi:ribosomal protein S8
MKKSNIDILKDYVAGVRPFVQVGYNGISYKKRAIGDKWTDAKGKDWEQRESGPVTVNRVADIVRAAKEQVCKCGQQIKWGSRSDQRFFNKTEMCENCLITYETKLRILGIYDDYEQYKMLSNELGFLKDARSKIKECLKFFSESSGDVEMVCNSEGFIERWKDINKDQILLDSTRDLKLATKKIAAITKLKKEAKKKYIENAAKYKIETYV